MCDAVYAGQHIVAEVLGDYGHATGSGYAIPPVAAELPHTYSPANKRQLLACFAHDKRGVDILSATK